MMKRAVRAGIVWFSCVVALASARVSAAGFEIVHVFGIPPADPYGDLAAGPDGFFYGTSSGGGANGVGTIFKVSTNGVVTVLYSFPSLNNSTNLTGAQPYAGLTLGPDGRFYGTTLAGGPAGNGTVFRVTTNGTLNRLSFFPALNNNTNATGSQPRSALTVGPDGNLYGTASAGGTNGYGTIFKVTTAGTVTTLATFANTNGANPYGGLAVGPDGNLYGATYAGGDYDLGCVFKVTTAGMLTQVVPLDPFSGIRPYAGLTLGPDGVFYGTASGIGYGSVFSVTTNGELNAVASFDGDNGAYPQSRLTLGPDGKFYGTTPSTENGGGTIYRVTTNGVLNVLTNFGAFDGAPQAGLALGQNGNLYGVSLSGSTSPGGAVFRVRTNGVFTTLVKLGASGDGLNPSAALIRGNDGKLYGSTEYGGTYGYGTLFQLTTDGDFASLLSFAQTNGEYPGAAFTVGADGKLYGTTALGGVDEFSGLGNGTVFQLNPGHSFTNLYSFPTLWTSTATNAVGAVPGSKLLLAPDGSFYGTATQGGTNGKGAVFRINTAGTLTNLHSFAAVAGNATGLDTNADGIHPTGDLVFGPDGNLYGTTYSAGPKGFGTVFKLTPGGELTTLVAFVATNGANPFAGLTLGPDGNFYGTTSAGGEIGYGTVFKVTTGGTLTTLFSFTSANGANPVGALAFGPDGNLYGTTSAGGANGYGTVFKLTTGGTLTTLVSFSSVNGAEPYVGLTLGPDNLLYGTTFSGGPGGGGVVYRFSPYPGVSLVMGADKKPVLSLASFPGVTTRLWATTNAALPMSQWQVIATNVMDANGLKQFTDTNAPTSGARFYRVSMP